MTHTPQTTSVDEIVEVFRTMTAPARGVFPQGFDLADIWLREQLNALLETAAESVENSSRAFHIEKMPPYAAFDISAYIIRNLKSK